MIAVFCLLVGVIVWLPSAKAAVALTARATRQKREDREETRHR